MPSLRARAASLVLLLPLAAPAAPPRPTAAAESSAAQALSQYRLSMDLVKRLASASKELKKKQDADRSFAEKIRPKTDENLEAAVKRLESTPEMMSVLKANGLSARDYVLGPMSLRDAMTVVTLEKDGKTLNAPKEIPRENVEFVKAHKAEIDALGLFPTPPPDRPKKPAKGGTKG